MNRLIRPIAAALVLASAGAFAASPDQMFVTKAGQGGMAEIALGKLAQSQGSSDSVKTFGEHMVDDHGKANDELASTAKNSGAMVADAPSAEQKATMEKMKAMKGDAFDKAYADAMVKDHKDTIALFEKESSSGKDEQLKAFATKTLPTLKKHQMMAQALPGEMK